MPERKTINFSIEAWEHYLHWQATDPAVLDRLNRLLVECVRTPFGGIGKPEPLRGKLAGYWSRRLTAEDRLVYRVTDDGILIIQARYHY